MLYLKPHHAHRSMGESIGADFVELERGNPLKRIVAAKNLDLDNKPIITEGGKPLFQAVWMKFFGNCGPIIHLAADETLPNIFDKYPHYKHHERFIHYLEHKYVDGVIGISDKICESARRLGICNVQKTYPFTEEWKFEKLTDTTPNLDSDKILVVGHNSDKNNLQTLEEIAKSCSSEVSIDVIGGGTETLDSEHVQGHGFIGDEDRFVQFFSNASCFLFPAVSQMFGVVVLEAMHAGLPPIVTEDVGAKEVLSPVDDRLIAKTTPEDLARSIDWYMSLPRSQKKSLSGQVRTVSKEHSPMEGIKRFEKSYENVINDL
ncbi:glycosyltransferase [Halobacterium sp. R2-5]|uniref:glycosyltransferase n=1 Tax=Halobacterium sp. R2-5 TaxID=2715751 RepID=UPI00141F01DE|nr:glycosyltransferase [Halobacterium sp. R2-5]NIB99454.1 glycosyltransferase family 4 protein [Halobacterium sp. R2-5]